MATTYLTAIGCTLAFSGPGRAAEAPKWAGHVEVVAKPNTAGTSGAVELFLPLGQDQHSLVFVDARLSASEDSELFGNFGVAMRRIIEADAIIGASVFFDHTRSEHKRSYYGVTLGLEALTETFDARVNFHAPLTQPKLLDFQAPVRGGTLSLEDLRLVEQLSRAGFIRHEVPHYGVEGEVGVKLPVGLPDPSDLRVFAGGYHYWASGMEDITGVSGRIEYQTRDLFGERLPGARLTVAGLVRHDDVRDTEFGGEVRLRLPFGGAAPSAASGERPSLTSLERRMTTRLVRQPDILTRTRTKVLGSGSGGTRLAINPETGEPYGAIVFADGANTPGAGTPDDPTTLDDAVDKADVNGVVVAEGSSGAIGTGGISLAEGMALIGGGTFIPVLLADGSIVQFGLGTSAGTIQGIGAVNVISLADGSRLENITVTGGQTAIAGYGYGNVALQDVTVSGTGGNAIAISNATGPLSFQGVSIFDSGGHGLALSGNAGPISVENLVVSGSAGHGISAINNAFLSIDGASIGGAGGAGVNVANSAGTNILSANQVAVSSAAGAGISVDGSAGGTTIVTSFADNVVEQAGAGGVLFETVSFDADPDAAGIQAAPGGNLLIGNLAAPGNIGGDGLHMNNVAGAIAFDILQIANDGGTGLFVRDAGGKAGSFSLSSTGGAVATAAGTAIDLDPVIVDVTLSSVDAAGGMHGLLLDNVEGTFSVAGPVTISDVTDAGIAIVNSSGTFSFGDTNVSDAGGAGIYIGEVSGSVSFGATEITDVAGTAIALTSNPADVSFGDTTIADPAGTGIDIEGANGAVTFGATTIAGLGAATGVDLTDGADPTQVALTFATLDIAGTGQAGSIGIDYSGSTNSGNVVTLDSGTIQGVEFGVDLTGASATGLFQYGDGSNTDADGAASTIDATVPLVIAGLNAANGTYNFLDTVLVGDTSALLGVDVFYVDVDGAGIGTADDPGSLTGAVASGADVIALVNTQNGAADLIDAAAGAQGTIDTVPLANGQQLVSFAAADAVNVGAVGAPANLLLFGITPGEVTNPNPGFGAPVLTTSAAGNDTVALGDGNILQGVVIANAGAANAVAGTGISGVTLFQSELTAELALTNATGDANLDQSELNSLTVSGGSIDITATGTSLTNGAGGAILAVNSGHSGDVGFDAASPITATGGGGLQFDNADGTYSFGGATMLSGVGTGIDIVGGSDGTFAFAGPTITNPTGAGVNIADSAAGVTFSGTTTIDGAGTNGVALSNTTGAIGFDALSITNPGGAGIDFSGAIGGPVTFTDLDIALQTDNTTGVDLSGATVNADITASDFDLTSTTATGTIGVNLVGTTGGGTVTLGTTTPPFLTGPSSTIAGVETGALFSSATNLAFIFGDGEAAVDVGSSIDATTPIDDDGTGLPVNGTYNFLDAQLIGDTTNLEAGNAYFVDNVIDGIDDGTAANPGTLAGAEASGADFIVLVDTQAGGAADTIDAASADQGAIDTLSLANGQQLLSFLNGDTINVGGGAPASFQLTGITTGQIDNPNPGSGAPNLTTTAAGADVVNLADGNVIDGIVITASAGAGDGIAGTDILDATIQNSQIAGTGSAIFIDTAALGLSTVTIANVTATSATTDAVSIAATDPASDLQLHVNDNTFSGAGAFGLLVNGDVAGNQQITVVELADNTVLAGAGGSAGMSFTGVDFDAGGGAAVAGGTTTLGADGDRLDGDGLVLNNVAGALDFDQLDIFNDGGTGLLVQNSKANNFDLTTGAGTIDTTNGTAIDLDPLSVAMTLTEVNSSGGAIGINLDDVDGTLTIQDGSIANTTGAAFNVNAGSIDVTYAGDITQANNAATVNVQGGHSGTLTFQTGTISATNGTGLQFDNADGIYNFTGTTTLTGGDSGIDIVNGSGGTFSFGDNTTITHNAAGDAFSLLNSSADVTYSGAITANSGHAVNIDNNSGTVTFQTGAISANGAAAQGIQVANSSGTVNFNGQTTLSTQGNNAVTLTGNAGGTVNFNAAGNGLDITTTSGTGFSATGGGTVTVQGSGNTINKTGGGGGTGITISGTTIGGAGVTFDSINVAAGSTSGIVLANTGNTGGAFTVTGDGTTTGGVLNRNGSGGTITGTTGDGVSLTNANNVVLQQLNIINAGDEAIESSGGGTFTFSAITIQNPAGHGWLATNLGGANLLDNGSLVTQINGVSTQGVAVTNTNTNLASLTVDNVTFSNSTTDAAALFLESNGTSNMTLNVQNGSEFTGLVGPAIQSVAGNSAGSSGTVNTNITGSSFHDAAANGLNHILLTASFAATHNVNVTGNTLDTLAQTATTAAGVIQLNISGTTNGATLQGTVANNLISNTGGRGAIWAVVDPANTSSGGANTLDLTISGNTIDNVPDEVDVISVNIQNAGGVAAPGTHEVTIDGNILGQGDIAGTTAGNLGERQVFEIVVVDGETLNILVNNNTATGNLNQDIFRAAAIQVVGGDPANLNLTLTNNNFTQNNAAGDNVVIEDLNMAGGTVCADIDNNTLAGAARNIDLTQTGGTFNVRQLSAADVQAQNPGTNQVNVTGTVNFNQGPCPVPTP